MAKASDPLVISFFATGLYTHRSQLFSPYRSVGVNVVTYHDAAIDGQDMELTTLLQWTRRPGFSRFCSVAFANGEIPIQFYSARQPAGTVVSFVDTNQNFSTFTSSALTPLFAKTTAAQGFIQQIGAMTYYANGKDFKKWNGALSKMGLIAPTTVPTVGFAVLGGKVHFWAPGIGAYSGTGQIVIVDSNGNFQTWFLVSPGAVPPIWNPSFLGFTKDGTGNSAWQNNGPYQGWQPSTAYVLNTCVVDGNGNVQIVVIAGTSAATPPTWATTSATTTNDNTVRWQCLSSANIGQPAAGSGIVTIQAGYVWAYAYRSIWGHCSTASPVPYTSGVGLGTFSVNIGGVGTSDPQCNQVITITSITIAANLLTVAFSGTPLNLVPGQNYTLSGLGAASFLNGQSVNVINAAGSLFTANFTHSDYGPTADSGSASFNGVEIYRTSDGGGLLYFDGSVVNPGAGVSWTFTDTTSDASLITSLIAPLDHLNDPPPLGGTIMAYWQGRMWMAVGNKLYFNAGPDCINGVPEESWPPANVFQYSGPILALSRTSQGLLVWGADYISMALGGPQTLSFYPYDLIQNFGISSPNCIAQDGDEIAVLNTAGQCFTLDVSGKSETGNYVTEVITGSFAPTTSYVTTHRQGLDSALWLSDGSVNALRYSLNIGSWSTEYKPVGGLKALKSIETSPGVNTLCAGRATGAGYILGRNLTTWQDDAQNYTNCFVTIGNIVLTPPGAQLVAVEHIVGYFDAVGTINGGSSVPAVSILPNEVSGTPGTGFLTLTNPVSEYTTATVPSTTLQSLRWPVDSMSSGLVSQWMHHLQIKVSFAPENAPNAIKSLAIMFKKDA